MNKIPLRVKMLNISDLLYFFIGKFLFQIDTQM
jgi:hypothetical protein